MRIFITGATGFVGKEVTAVALERGHQVRAVVRPSSTGTALKKWFNNPNFELAKVDLRSPAGLAESLTDVDLVIHLAATKAGDFYTQFAGTVIGTENLLDAMTKTNVTRLVGVSTFSVYDYSNTAQNTLVDETSATETSPELRDEYTRTKLIQEKMYRTFGDGKNHNVVILRPGMIFGAGELWHALLGSQLGPRFLRVGSSATLPLNYVENCADAIVLAAEVLCQPDSKVDGEIINLVDDHLPTQQQYAELVGNHTEVPKSITVPWIVMRSFAGAIKTANTKFAKGRAKFPGIVVPDRLNARFKPLRYTNQKAKKLLGWQPAFSISDAVRRSVELENSQSQDNQSQDSQEPPNTPQDSKTAVQ